MNPYKFAAIACLLCGGAAAPAADGPRDDLEVTMQVFDDLAAIDSGVASLRRPRSRAEPEVSAEEPEMQIEAGPNDRFEHDDIDENDRERALESEHEIEDGEEVDYDQYDIIDDMG